MDSSESKQYATNQLANKKK